MVTRVNLNSWKRLTYYDPEVVLRAIGKLDTRPIFGWGSWDFEKDVVRESKSLIEQVDAAIFSYLIGKMMGIEVSYSPIESADFDGILAFDMIKEVSLNPVQLKEVIPEEIDPNFSLSKFTKSLQRYVDSKDLILAIKINREFDYDSINLKELEFSSIYFYGQDPKDPKSLWLKGGVKSEIQEYKCRWPS